MRMREPCFWRCWRKYEKGNGNAGRVPRTGLPGAGAAMSQLLTVGDLKNALNQIPEDTVLLFWLANDEDDMGTPGPGFISEILPDIQDDPKPVVHIYIMGLVKGQDK